MTYAEAKALYEKQPEATQRALDYQFATREVPMALEFESKKSIGELWSEMIERVVR